MSDKKIALLAVLLGAVINCAAPGVTKVGLHEIPPLTFAALRFVIASLCILPFFLYARGHKLLQMRELVPISLFASVNIIFFALGIKLTTANIGGTLYAAVPLLTAIILYLFFKQKLSPEKVLGILVGFVGVSLITLLPIIEKGQLFAGNLLGNFLILCGVTSWSFYMVYSKKLYKKYSPFIVLSNLIFTSTIMLIPLALWEVQTSTAWVQHVSVTSISALVYVAVVISIFAYLCTQYAVKHGGAVFAATTFYVTPALGIVANFFLLGERITPGFIVGSVLALFGTFLVMRR